MATTAYCGNYNSRNCYDDVPCGETCEGDGECGTDGNLDNCDIYDVYERSCPMSTPRPTPRPTLQSASGCVNDYSTSDTYGDTCLWYDSNSGGCGSFDDADFTASAQCCACGGGLVGSTTPAQTGTFTFTGGDPGEGLDFTGDFVYAVDISGPGGVTIGDAVFTSDGTTPGFSVSAQYYDTTWYSRPGFGSSPNDDGLELLMHSIRYSYPPTPVTVTMEVEQGTYYRLQLLFYEQCCYRGFDVLVDGMRIVDEFSPQIEQGGPTGSSRPGAAIYHEFVATSSTTTVTLDGISASFSDTNPILNAVTLERIPGGDSFVSFVYVDQELSWEDARAHCRANYHDLASIHSSSENAEVTALCPNQCWLGGSDSAREGTWTWSDGTAWDYTNWYPGEPNDYGSGQDFLHIYAWESAGRWDDTTGEYQPFVCSISSEDDEEDDDPTTPDLVEQFPTDTPQPTPWRNQVDVVIKAAIMLTGITADDFNSDPAAQQAFTQSILAHLSQGLIDDGAQITDVVAVSIPGECDEAPAYCSDVCKPFAYCETSPNAACGSYAASDCSKRCGSYAHCALRRRRLQTGGVGDVWSRVEVSHTIIVQQDETTVTDGGASVLTAVTSSLSSAVSTGAFLQTLIDEADAAGASATFDQVDVDVVATLLSLEAATVIVKIGSCAVCRARSMYDESNGVSCGGFTQQVKSKWGDWRWDHFWVDDNPSCQSNVCCANNKEDCCEANVGAITGLVVAIFVVVAMCCCPACASCYTVYGPDKDSILRVWRRCCPNTRGPAAMLSTPCHPVFRTHHQQMTARSSRTSNSPPARAQKPRAPRWWRAATTPTSRRRRCWPGGTHPPRSPRPKIQQMTARSSNTSKTSPARAQKPRAPRWLRTATTPTRRRRRC